jgi:hypothetical protein
MVLNRQARVRKLLIMSYKEFIRHDCSHKCFQQHKDFLMSLEQLINHKLIFKAKD